MTAKILAITVGLLLVIPNSGLPVPEKDTRNANNTENKGESSETVTSSTEKPADGTTKSNDASKTTTTTKSSERPNTTQTSKTVATTTAQPDVDEDDHQMYLIIPAPQMQMPNFKFQQPVYFSPNRFQAQSMKPQFMFNQQPMQMPYSYPMSFQSLQNPIDSMKAKNYMDYDWPAASFDSNPVFSVPQSQGQLFFPNTNPMNNKHASSFMPRPHSWYGGTIDSDIF